MTPTALHRNSDLIVVSRISSLSHSHYFDRQQASWSYCIPSSRLFCNVPRLNSHNDIRLILYQLFSLSFYSTLIFFQHQQETPTKIHAKTRHSTPSTQSTQNLQLSQLPSPQPFTMGKLGKSRATQHCPKASKGNCRKVKHPTMKVYYCT